MNKNNPAQKLNLTEAISVLKLAPSTVSSLLKGLPSHILHFSEGPEEWSPYIVLVHLIHNEKVNWVPRIKELLSNPNVSLVSIDQLPHRIDESVSITLLLEEFQSLRMRNLAEVGKLDITSMSLEKTGRHPSLGVIKVSEVLSAWMIHDLNHVHQISKTISHYFNSLAGPYREFLKILDQ
ncbi:MAG: DinB family protein [Chloroflexi bacterium]|nr:DinB family protein [Chloroflexota bacterium]